MCALGLVVFRHQRHRLLFEQLMLHFVEGPADKDAPEDYDSMRFESEVEKNQVGVGDGD